MIRLVYHKLKSFAHTGVEGNETAEAVANEVTAESHMDIYLQFPPTYIKR